ncbi:3-hydroxyacyl-CoA dehydrogenase [Microbaculum marinum]|uniref:3-hydroxyacyl-CoA dehydrogenase n=1 Tax=Microbaculum marinum TaxID=1764581 RepID=A0AAW9RKN6_9HYPH
MTRPVGIVGAGLVGSGWAIVFARAGYPVRVFDSDARTMATFAERVRGNLEDLARYELIDSPDAVFERVEMVDTLEQAVGEADHVQESVFERTDVKQAIYRQIDEVVGADTVVGSSSSGIPASEFTDGLDHRENYLVVHPVNPPYLVPVVEIVPAPWTRAEAVERATTLMEAVGQVPVLVRREVAGFVLNRLQGALLREAWALYEEGYASLEDIDKTVSAGLGRRWSFMGPFETIDLNAPGGISDYAERLGGLYLDIARQRSDPQPWSRNLIARADAERRGALPKESLGERTKWRDRRLMALSAFMARSREAEGE